MLPSFQAFAEKLIDYAGMFPPTELPLDQALRRYLEDRNEGDAWMLGRFVCRIDLLENLAAAVEALPPAEPALRVAAIGRGGGNTDAYLSGLLADLAAVAALHQRPGARVRVDIVETRLPEFLLTSDDGRHWNAFLEAVSGLILRSATPGLRVYHEGSFPVDRPAGWARAIEGVSGRRSGTGGIKLRCGGTSASAVPSVEQVAFVLAACGRSGASFKATAGLHHPVRVLDPSVGTKRHGFLNVFGAALLARQHGLDEKEIHPIIAEEDPSAFRFTSEAFYWKGLSISVQRIRELRGSAVTSFGSCSFDEPREGLRALGLLGPKRGAAS
jgi:hypothetical protein